MNQNLVMGLWIVPILHRAALRGFCESCAFTSGVVFLWRSAKVNEKGRAGTYLAYSLTSLQTEMCQSRLLRPCAQFKSRDARDTESDLPLETCNA
jgi:hypothetical protein